MGFEPGAQAGNPPAEWEGFKMDYQVMCLIQEKGYGGMFVWALGGPGTDVSKSTTY